MMCVDLFDGEYGVMPNTLYECAASSLRYIF